MPSMIAAGEFNDINRCSRLAWMLESVTMALRHRTPVTSFCGGYGRRPEAVSLSCRAVDRLRGFD